MERPIDADGYYTDEPFKGFHRLHAAVYEGDTELVRAFLAAGDKCNHARKEFGPIPLVEAAHNDDEECMLLLLDHKADVNLVHDEGWSILHHMLALDRNHWFIERILVLGATIDEKAINQLEEGCSNEARELVEKARKWQLTI
ncbi:MAG: ankyrin repeat domain-containing protein [Patescibacteria group bacterium]|nr:ankyrin repeat domain-containing protein [Patescibacteria group bacterium]